jgi:hypothetical protein
MQLLRIPAAVSLLVASTAEALTAQELTKALSSCTTGTAARRVLEQALLPNNRDTSRANPVLYQSLVIPPDASSRGLSDGDLAIQTRTRVGAISKYGILDVIDLQGNRDANRVSLAVLTVFVGSTLSALVAQQSLPGPEIVRFTVVWILVFAPLALSGWGIATPAGLQGLLVRIQSLLFPTYRKRMIQHEAGHFLMGHLLGYPIQDYQVNFGKNAVQNAVTFYPLNDIDAGRDRAQQLGFDARTNNNRQEDDMSPPPFDQPFFSPQGRGSQIMNRQSVFRRDRREQQQPNDDNDDTRILILDDPIPSTMDPTQSWPYRPLDDATLDKLAVISVAGVCAEVLAFGNAEGGLADFNQLKQLLAAGTSPDQPITQRQLDNRIRFALGYTMTQLRRHLAALDALAVVMDRQGTIAECVVALESQAQNPSGNNGIRQQDYEQRRKEQFQPDPIVGIIESLLLGQPKTVDTPQDNMVEGKGGGYKKETTPLLTGDDPFFLALGLATVFLLWASNGGLSLH